MEKNVGSYMKLKYSCQIFSWKTPFSKIIIYGNSKYETLISCGTLKKNTIW